MKTKILGIHEKEATQAMIEHIKAECSTVDTDKLYDDMLDECYSFESVGGCFSCMSPSRVLSECDPIAYRCGKNDWLDGERDNFVEVGSDYYRKDDVDDAAEAFIDEKRDELSELEGEHDELESDEETERNELDTIRDKISRLESIIAACENYAW